MELVALAKCVKRRTYGDFTSLRTKNRKVIAHVAASQSEYQHPYVQQRETINRVGFIIVTSDRVYVAA